MRVAILSPYPTFRHHAELGCERVSYQNNATWTVILARHLAQLPDTEVHVVTQAEEIPCSKTITADNVTVHFIKSPSRFKTLTLWQFDRRRLHRALAAIQPDIVHGQGVENQYGYAAVTAGRPCLITIHGIPRLAREFYSHAILDRHKLVEFFEAYCLRKASNFVIINPFVAEVQGLQPNHRRLFPIANAVAEDFFGSSPTPRQTNCILSLGTIESRKGFDILLAALARLKDRGQNVGAKIIGATPAGMENYQVTLAKYARDHSLDVEFTGNLPPAAVAEQLRHCTALVHPARHETAPMAIAESMATGAPVLASNVGGVRYMIDDGKNGLLFRSEDEVELADKLARLMTDVALRQRLGRAAAETARQTYHPQRVATLTRQAYEVILK